VPRPESLGGILSPSRRGRRRDSSQNENVSGDRHDCDMSTQGPVEARRLGEISTANPTLALLGAYSRDWVLPLFAEHLEPVEGSVSAEWFHERVAEALQEAREDKEWQGDRSPGSRCAWWVKQRWLDTEMSDSGARYRLSPYSLRALRFVREIADGESTVSGARLGSIAHAVRRLADMTSPDRFAQAQRIDEEIAELQRRRQEVLEGRGSNATTAQLGEQLREVLAMTRSLPADFRQLRSMVEDRHKVVAREALAETPKADMVESYLHENDLLAGTPEGVAYRRFARMLSSSEESATIQRDLDQILVTPFARDHMTPTQRQSLEAMFSTLMSAELDVQEAYVHWTASLRRVLTRAAHGQYARLLSLSSLALEAAAEWVAADPHGRGREVGADVLGVGLFGIEDVSQMQLWRDTGPQNVTVKVAAGGGPLPAGERAALRLAAGTSPKAVARRINDLVAEHGVVTAAEVFEHTPAEFQRLGSLVTMLDLAVQPGTVDPEVGELVTLSGNREHELAVLLPHLAFHEPIAIHAEEK
jgi:hypothetical protein